MTGVEVVRFAACLSGMNSVEGLRRAHEILDFCGMKQERYRAIESYSTGMRQKIKFASSIVHDPRFLILDEPTSGLDPEEREQLLYRIRLLADVHGKSVLLSTHILPDVQQVCDSVVILSNGTVKLNASFEQLNRPTSSMVTVTLLGDEDAFCQRAENRGVRIVAREAGELRLEGHEAGFTDSLWQIAGESGALIQSIRPARNSLEEVFLSAVREAAHAAS
jgi:ABC-2 type transport system ATP-binding protein